jgi:hypothetical protein
MTPEPKASSPYSQEDRHRFLSWANWIHSTILQPVSLRSILIPTSHLRLGLPSGLSSSGFLTRILYSFISSPMHATCPFHLFLLDLICLIIEVPHCATPPILLLLHPSLVQMFSVGHCSQGPLVYALPLMWGTSFTPIQNNRQNYTFQIRNINKSEFHLRGNEEQTYIRPLLATMQFKILCTPARFFPEGGVGLVPKRGCLLTLAYYAFPRWYEFGERWWNDIDRGKPKNS